VIKVAFLTEDIAILSKILIFYLWKPFFNDQIDIFICLALIFGWNIMSSEESGNNIYLFGIFLFELLDNFEEHNFCVEIKTIA